LANNATDSAPAISRVTSARATLLKGSVEEFPLPILKSELVRMSATLCANRKRVNQVLVQIRYSMKCYEKKGGRISAALG
jgi:hypothetical protein